MLVGVGAADDRRSSGSISCDGEVICLALTLCSSVNGASECSGGDVASDDPSHRHGGRARTGNDKAVEIDPELKTKIVVSFFDRYLFEYF